MNKCGIKLLKITATIAESAFWRAMGLASLGGMYEPKIPEYLQKYRYSDMQKKNK